MGKKKDKDEKKVAEVTINAHLADMIKSSDEKSVVIEKKSS